ncbi:MAG: hypothetical protein WAR37_04740 [Candidatus Microsaccharimonas sp.]
MKYGTPLGCFGDKKRGILLSRIDYQSERFTYPIPSSEGMMHPDIFEAVQATFRTARDEKRSAVNPFDVLITTGNGSVADKLGLSSTRLSNWNKLNNAKEARHRDEMTTQEHDPFVDMLDVMVALWRFQPEQYRHIEGVTLLLAGVFGSNSKLIEEYCKQAYISRESFLVRLGLEIDDLKMLDGRRKVLIAGRR